MKKKHKKANKHIVILNYAIEKPSAKLYLDKMKESRSTLVISNIVIEKPSAEHTWEKLRTCQTHTWECVFG